MTENYMEKGPDGIPLFGMGIQAFRKRRRSVAQLFVSWVPGVYMPTRGQQEVARTLAPSG